MTDKEKFDSLMKHLVLEYDYGSYVYGTLTDKSDRDIVCVVDDAIDLSDSVNGIWEYHADGNMDYQFINSHCYRDKVRQHHILWLECYSLPKEHILFGRPEEFMPDFKLDKWELRKVISQISSNAWAKAGKKMTIAKDFDLYRGQKSLFHSLRIMMFGIQIAKFGKIVDYKEANHYWDEIYAMGNCGWDVYKEKYQPIANAIRSELVAVCPKPDNYKSENQNKKKGLKMEYKKGFDINEKIVDAMKKYKDVCKQVTEMSKEENMSDEREEIYRTAQSAKNYLKQTLDVYKLIKTAFMEYVTDDKGCDELVKRGVLTFHMEKDEKTQKDFRVIEQEVSERIVMLPEDVQNEIMEKMVGVRRKNVDIYTKNGRPEMASAEQKELDIINTLLPKEATREDIEEAVRKNYPDGITPGMMKTVIGETKAMFTRVEGKLVAQVVQSFLKK